jgi:hypothetical protein
MGLFSTQNGPVAFGGFRAGPLTPNIAIYVWDQSWHALVQPGFRPTVPMRIFCGRHSAMPVGYKRRAVDCDVNPCNFPEGDFAFL